MKKLLSEIETAIQYELYFVALQSALTLPDICGALESDDGLAKKAKYVNWYNKYFQPKYDLMLSAEDCYYFRCANIHQGSFQHKKSSYDRIVFMSGNSTIDNNKISIINRDTKEIENIYTLDIRVFCNRMISTTKEWFDMVQDDENFKKNYAKMIKVHGLPPIFGGSPAIY